MTSSGTPDVLLVIPTLGRRIDYLRQALASITAQDHPVHLVLVAPTSATEARAIASDVGAEILDDPGGLSAAINVGMSAATPAHRYANWLGDDDLLAPGAIGSATGALDHDSAVAVAYGHCTYIDGNGREVWVSRAGRLAPRLLSWGPNLIPQPGMLFRLDDFRVVGGLDESLRFSMDLDLLLRLRRRGRLVDLGLPVSSFRWHTDSTTVSDRAASLAEAEMVKRRYLPNPVRRAAPLWETPVRAATHFAVRAMARRAAQRH